MLTKGWPSPILIDTMENKNLVDETANYILKTYDLNLPPSENNKENIFDDKNLKEFKQEIVEPAFDSWFKQVRNQSIYDYRQRSYTSWITNFNNGYSMVTHNHNGSQLSAVFYLLNEESDFGGEIVFFDPRSNANRAYNNKMWKDFFEPLVLKVPSYTFAVFPSFIYHQVTNFRGKIRLAVPVDLYV
jgi:hypothetical protein